MTIFGDAVQSGAVNPRAFAELWVETGETMSGGSANQLELPRLASRFFGAAPTHYDDTQHEIIRPVLRARGHVWHDRKLTWHGNNRMERINLPTRTQGGFLDYARSVVLFRRRADGAFDLEVQPIDGYRADEWRSASAASGTLYLLGGANSHRRCGLI